MASTSRSSALLVALLCLLVFGNALRTRSRISLDNSIGEPDNSLLETLSRTTQDEDAEDDSLARFAEAAQRRAAEHSDDANDAVAQAEARFAEAAEAESATSASDSDLGVAGGEEADSADTADDAPRAAVSEQVEELVEGEEADDENADEATAVHPTAHRQRFAAATPAPSKPTAPAPSKPAASAPSKPAAPASKPAAPSTKSVVNAAKSAAAASKVKPGYQLATQGFQPPCDLVVSQGLCLFGGQKVILPDATSKGLTAWFKFDEAHPIDSSRFNNHGVSVIPHGMGRGGIGSSARFDGEVWMEVVSSNSLATMLNESSVSFWAFFPPDPENPTNYECPIIHLGREFETVFDLRYNPVSRRLSANRIRNWVTLKSRARPALRQWHHFALTASKKSFKLYVNGILDAQADIPAELSPGGVLDKPSFQFFAGSLPWTPASKCRVPVLIDDLKLFNRALRREEIEAESFPSLGAAEPSFVRFGCENCYFDDARKSCPSNYHLCYKPELVSGALSIGRKMGWVSVATPIWENDVTENHPEHQGSPGEMRAGFCCAD